MQLPQAPSENLPDSAVCLLLSRDEISRVLKENGRASEADIASIAMLDKKLKDWADKRMPGSDRARMSAWRESLQPSARDWWWLLDERARPSVLWTLFAGLFFAASLAVAADTFTVLKNVTSSNVTLAGTIAQSMLALFAGSAFTSAGREWLSQIFSAVGSDRMFLGQSRMWLALGVFVLILGGRFYLPDFASKHFNVEGGEYAASGLLSRSIESYQQAIALKPYYVDAHLGLAASLAKSHEYEKAIEEYKRVAEIDLNQTATVIKARFEVATSLDRSHEYEKAIDEYTRVIELDPNQFTAVSKLSRLYILHRRDSSRALSLLEPLFGAYRNGKLPNEECYRLFKNSGWANLELRNYRLAEGELRAALQFRDGAAAHFLLGKTLDSLHRVKEARDEWTSFIKQMQQGSKQEDEVEPDWPGYAQTKQQGPIKGESFEKGGHQ